MRVPAFSAIFAAVLLMLVACGPGAPPPPTAAPAPAKPTAAPVATPTAAAKPTAAATAAPAAVDLKAEMAGLYEEAKKEGALVLYSSMNLDDARLILPAFEKAYPGIKIDHVRATGETLQQRVITETRGGKVLGDVFDTNAAQFYPVVQQGLMEAYPIPSANDLPPEFRDTQGYWTTGRVTTVNVAYNREQLKPSEEPPQTFDDMADPRWKGRLLMEPADQEMMIILLRQKFPNEEQGMDFFRKVAANQPEFHPGHTELADFLAAGQGAVCFGCYGHHIVALHAKGAPVDFAKKEGVLYTIVSGLFKGAPHPNAGKLYLNWLMSPEGQTVLGANGRAPARPNTPLSTPIMPSGMKWYPSRLEFLAEMSKYEKMWQEVFNLRGTQAGRFV
jgi:ABC-type Fe3+ transport system substrate-binding protein